MTGDRSIRTAMAMADAARLMFDPRYRNAFEQLKGVDLDPSNPQHKAAVEFVRMIAKAERIVSAREAIAAPTRAGQIRRADVIPLPIGNFAKR